MVLLTNFFPYLELPRPARKGNLIIIILRAPARKLKSLVLLVLELACDTYVNLFFFHCNCRTSLCVSLSLRTFQPYPSAI